MIKLHKCKEVDLHVEVHSDTPEEGKPRREGVNVETGFKSSSKLLFQYLAIYINEIFPIV